MTAGVLCGVAGLVIGLGASAATAGGVVGDAFDGTPVQTGYVAEFFLIDDPFGATSPAWRVNNDQVEKDGFIPAPTPGYVLHNAVIVRQAEGVVGAAAWAGAHQAEALDFAPGFYLVRTAHVQEAIELASALQGAEGVAEAYIDLERPRTLRTLPTDPSFNQQWHLRNLQNPIASANLPGAWAQGYTGQGVTVGILEGGWQYSHPDLAANYVAAATQVGSPTSHATACAGIAAAVGNNGLGGVGAAFNAGVSGQLYGSASQTASALNFRNDLNDIKSNSWGPSDNGRLHTISSVEYAALANSINGRGGLGTIIAWAAGNGGTNDRVEYDPWAASRFSLAIGAVGDQDTRAWYNELGSSMLVVTHSSGNNRGTWTTTTGSSYTSNFGGTSSASPLAAGVVALMLEANPGLTWRDVQHVLIESARKVQPSNNQWTTNAAGYDINYNYGFGAIDAEAAVALAAQWVNVGEEVEVLSGWQTYNVQVPDNNQVGVSREIEIQDNIRIESVELIVNIQTTYVGDLQIDITSPQGTNSILTVGGRNDPQSNMNNYRLTSLRHFGEESAGTWTVRVRDLAAGDIATWQNAQLRIYGTAIDIAACAFDLTGPALDGVPDGEVNISDLNYYLGLWMAGDPAADFTGPALDGVPDGLVNTSDLNYFLEGWLTGCD